MDGQLITTALPLQPRARGTARVAARVRDGRSVLSDLFMQGSAKVLMPRTGPGPLEAVVLNTAGGVTGGDGFRYEAEAETGARLSLSTQAAERAYRAQPGQTGQIDVGLKVGAGARIDWLPQETIVFDHASVRRRIDADLAPNATLLAVEALIFGRRAMNERLSALDFADQWRVHRGGELIYADALRLVGDGDLLARPATLNGAGAMASVLLAAPDADRLLAPLRALLPTTGGASLVRDGVLAARLAAPDGFELRRHLIPMLELLRGLSLPQVWKI